MRVSRLFGVYHANGSILGKLIYGVGKLGGMSACALCDVTHSLTRKKSGFSACKAALPIPVTLLHLDEQSPDLARFTKDRTPCVVGETDEGLVMLLDTRALQAMEGSVRKFDAALRDALAQIARERPSQ